MGLNIIERLKVYYYHKRGLNNLRVPDFGKCLLLEMKGEGKDNYYNEYLEYMSDLYAFLIKMYPGVTLDTINKMRWSEVEFRVAQSRKEGEQTLIQLEALAEQAKLIQREMSGNGFGGNRGYSIIESDK